MANPHAATPQEMFDLVSGRRTDEPDWFQFGEVTLNPADIVQVLESRVSDDRRVLFEQVLAERTEQAVVVIEGMVDMGNVGAVMRSADGFGIQTVHTVDTAGTYKRSKRTTQGTDKWIDRIRWEDPSSCVSALHNDGFSVIATDLAPGSRPIAEMDLSGRVAIVFGNELDGISDEMRGLVDERMVIPMSGFAESFNISVAAALTLAEVRRQRVEVHGRSGDLDADRKDVIRAVWHLKSVRESRLIVERALADGSVGGSPSPG